MSKDVKVFHNYADEKKESFSEVVAEWRQRAKKMHDETNDETRIQRWSYSNGLYKYFDNPGKEITDSNPYLMFVDLDEYDRFVKNQPIPLDPPAFNNKNRPNFFGTSMDETLDDPQEYKHHLHTSFERIMNEAEGIDVPLVAENKTKNPEQLKQSIIDFAKSLGFKSIGVTKVDRRFIAVEVDDHIIFDTIIILGYEVPKEIVQRYPEPKHDTAAYFGYYSCAKHIHTVADYIRSEGYDCRARSWEGFIKYPVHAVNAGMGNMSTYGICHTPEIGTRLKYASILIDAELPLDKPKDYNIEEFCSRCRLCQKSCPVGAIPKDAKRYLGTVRRVTDHIKCFESMCTRKECVGCWRVCPISMISYDHCMTTLPSYYYYNPNRDDMPIDKYREEVGQ